MRYTQIYIGLQNYFHVSSHTHLKTARNVVLRVDGLERNLMMAYLALYREWRPQTFGAIIGQEHITRTLKNAVAAGRVGHAYLFCGTRGTGKTTTAKVLAKALNCLQPEGPEPCNRCDNCTAITDGSSVDVIEIDAASNRGIDEIRDLREKVQFAPSSGRFRVYIIDEVHMLTNEAFNALLKTLEEPPRHAVLILATTEPHKIPLTILSRCQRFDFKRITPADIIGRLQVVAAGAHMEVEEEALRLIARAAEGGLRDALSLLDQAAAFGSMTITAGDVHNLLGTVRVDALNSMAVHLAAGEVGQALRLVGQFTTEGKDLRLFAREMAAYLRALLLEKIAPGAAAEEAWDNAGIRACVSQFNEERLVRAVEIMAAAEQEMKWSTLPGIVLELALIKVCRQAGGEDLASLTARLNALEKKINKPGADRVAPESLPAARELPPTYKVLETGLKNREPAGLEKGTGASNTPLQAGQKGRQGSVPVMVADKPSPSLQEEVLEPPKQPGTEASGLVELEEVKGAWSEILGTVRTERLPLYHNYLKAVPLSIKGRGLLVGFPEGDELSREMAELPDNKNYLAALLSRFFKGDWQVGFKYYKGEASVFEPSQRSKPAIVDVTKQFGGEEVDLEEGSDKLF